MLNVRSEIDSDSHNFQRRGVVEEGILFRHRSLFCEYKIYSPESRFRRVLDEITSESLKSLPKFEVSSNFVLSLEKRECKFLSVSPLHRKLSDLEVEQIGGVLALMNFLGVGDLHKNNILFGVYEKRVIFAPVDLEVFYQKFRFTQMGLVSADKKHLRCCSGISLFLEYLGRFPDPDFSVKLLFGYYKYLEAFLSNKSRLEEAFLGDAKAHECISRIVFRDTRVYLPHVGGKKVEHFLNEENEQLERGDIPYFFSFVMKDSERQFWWKTPDKYLPLKQNKRFKCEVQGQIPDLGLEDLLYDFFMITQILDKARGAETSISSYKGFRVIHKREFKFFLSEKFRCKMKAGNWNFVDSELAYIKEHELQTPQLFMCPTVYNNQVMIMLNSLYGFNIDIRFLDYKNKFFLDSLDHDHRSVDILYLLKKFKNFSDTKIKYLDEVIKSCNEVISELDSTRKEYLQDIDAKQVNTAKIEHFLEKLSRDFKKIEAIDSNLSKAIFMPLLFSVLSTYPFHEFTELAKFYRGSISNENVARSFDQIQRYKKEKFSYEHPEAHGMSSYTKMIKLTEESYAKFNRNYE